MRTYEEILHHFYSVWVGSLSAKVSGMESIGSWVPEIVAAYAAAAMTPFGSLSRSVGELLVTAARCDRLVDVPAKEIDDVILRQDRWHGDHDPECSSCDHCDSSTFLWRPRVAGVSTPTSATQIWVAWPRSRDAGTVSVCFGEEGSSYRLAQILANSGELPSSHLGGRWALKLVGGESVYAPSADEVLPSAEEVEKVWCEK